MLVFSVTSDVVNDRQEVRVQAGARDLEESIGVSLSARRFEVPAVTC